MEENVFITEIKINELRHLHDITIPIVKNGDKMKHLILTGKNGSGKTSLLDAIAKYIDVISTDNTPLPQLIREVEQVENKTFIDDWKGGIQLAFYENISTIKSNNPPFVKAFFKATRYFILDKPVTIEKVEILTKGSILANNSSNFLKYLVFLRSKLTDASYRGDKTEVSKIENWFSNFEKTLQKIFGDKELKLKYDSNNLNFNIVQENKNLFDFNTLSDGYAAILRIVTELMLQMEPEERDSYDINGIVLIDEIETHLHIELQKSILPFLISFFPKVQFIVTTHSPFILNSIENAVVYDLENNLRFEDASELSYSSLIKNYFLVDSEYSHLMEKKIVDFELLINKQGRTEADDEKLADLLVDLKTLSPLLSPEMYIRFQQAQKKIMKKTTAGN